MRFAGRLYIAKAFGWQGIVRAANSRDALRELKTLASNASLLPADISSCRRATSEEVEWHKAMTGCAV